jgi:carotenoid cleavage dioxygenase-like enzyme
MLKVRREYQQQLESEGNPYLDGVWRPTDREIVAEELEVVGEVPVDLNGVYLRNGPNPRYQPRGRYHVFDGDGMLHAARFDNGQVTYRNRWIQTAGLKAEEAAGQAIWPGLIERPDRSLETAWGSDHWLKDNSNTDVVLFNGRAVTTFYQCGDGYVVDPVSLDTVGALDLSAMGIRSLSAHAMVDEQTGELLFFDYATQAPFMTYGVLGPDGQLRHHVPINLPGPRLPHTLAFTDRHTILMDLPLFWDPELMRRDAHKVTFFPELPSRFGILPRFGDDASVRWFEAESTYIYHICNAWEEGDEIVLDACRMRTPEPPPVPPGADISRMLAWGKLDASLYRYRFNLASGETREEWRDDLHTEFPMINTCFAGRKSRYAYHMMTDDDSMVLRFDGIAKYDLETTAAETWRFPGGWFASESPFAPRDAATDEDDGYLVTFVTDSASSASEIQVFDARGIADGPVARVKLPQRVPAGFHSCWAAAGDIDS